MNYTNSEMCDMHFVYGRANGNSLAAMRLYEGMYPNRVIPHHTMFARLHQCLGETVSFKKNLPMETGALAQYQLQMSKNRFSKNLRTVLKKLPQKLLHQCMQVIRPFTG